MGGNGLREGGTFRTSSHCHSASRVQARKRTVGTPTGKGRRATIESLNRVRQIVSEENADTMSNDELLDACIDLAASREPTAPPSVRLEATMASLRQLTDGSAGLAFRNDVLHDMAHEATELFEAEYGVDALGREARQ